MKMMLHDMCTQRRLRSDCADAQADLSLHWGENIKFYLFKVFARRSMDSQIPMLLHMDIEDLSRLSGCAVFNILPAASQYDIV